MTNKDDDDNLDKVYGLDAKWARLVFEALGLKGEDRNIVIHLDRLKKCSWCSWTQTEPDFEAQAQHSIEYHKDKFTDQFINDQINRIRNEQNARQADLNTGSI